MKQLQPSLLAPETEMEVPLQDIVSMIQSGRMNSPWPTPLSTQNRQDLLTALRPGSKADVALLMGRFLQHYPSRETTRDASLITDFDFDIRRLKISLCAVMESLIELREGVGLESGKFLPDTKEILDRMKSKTASYRERLTQSHEPTGRARPRPEEHKPMDPWVYKTYDQCKDLGLLEQVEAHCLQLAIDLGETKAYEYRLYLHNMCGFPKPISPRSLGWSNF